jgi:hypothetical protein
MPRSEAFIQADVEERFRKLGHFRDAGQPEPDDPVPDGYLEELVPAGVPACRRDYFVTALKEEVRRYRVFELANRQERPSRRAKGFQEVAASAKALLKVLRTMPAAQRMPLEPTDPAGIIKSGRRPIEEELVDLIEKAEIQRKQWGRLVSRTRSRRQNTLLRDDFARGLKALAIGYLGKDERAAEAWVARVLGALGVKCPDPVARYRDFKRMFVAVAPDADRPPLQPREQGTDPDLDARLKGITLADYMRLAGIA